MYTLVYHDIFKNYIDKYKIHNLYLELYLTKYNCVYINRFNSLQTSLYSDVVKKELYIKFYHKLSPTNYCFVWPEDKEVYLLIIRAYISKAKTQLGTGIYRTIIYQHEDGLICKLMELVIKNSTDYSSVKYGLK